MDAPGSMRGVLRLNGTELGAASAAADGRPLSACLAAFKPAVMALLTSAEAGAVPASGAEAVPDDVYADEAPPGEDGTEGLKLPAKKKAKPFPRPEVWKPQG